MTLFEELDAIFPAHTHFYIVNLPSIDEALERCARLTGSASHVTSYNGQLIMAVQHGLNVDDITWLTEVPRPAEYM